MKNFVISLTTATGRRAHIEQQFSAQQIDFEFFDAVTPASTETLLNQFGLITKQGALTDGELACFLSHFSICKKIVDDGLEYAAIFEDDIVLGEGAASYLNSYGWIPKSFNFIKIEAFWPTVKTNSPSMRLPYGRRKIFKLASSHDGMAGYIISSSAAQSLIDYIRDYGVIRPVDHIVFREYIKNGKYPVFQVNPALCIQDDVLNRNKPCIASQLEPDRKRFLDARRLEKQRSVELDDGVNTKKKLTLMSKAQREWLRIVRQVQRFLFERRIEFR